LVWFLPLRRGIDRMSSDLAQNCQRTDIQVIPDRILIGQTHGAVMKFTITDAYFEDLRRRREREAKRPPLKPGRKPGRTSEGPSERPAMVRNMARLSGSVRPN